MPGKAGNTNAITHGVNSYLATGKLPVGCSNIEMKTNKLKANLIAAVQECHGQVAVHHELLVHTAVRNEVAALLIQKWLADAESPGFNGRLLTPDQRLAHLKAICSASDARDRAVKALGLDRRDESHATIYTLPAPTGDEPEGQTNAPPEPSQATD